MGVAKIIFPPLFRPPLISRGMRTFYFNQGVTPHPPTTHSCSFSRKSEGKLRVKMKSPEWSRGGEGELQLAGRREEGERRRGAGAPGVTGCRSPWVPSRSSLSPPPPRAPPGPSAAETSLRAGLGKRGLEAPGTRAALQRLLILGPAAAAAAGDRATAVTSGAASHCNRMKDLNNPPSPPPLRTATHSAPSKRG